MAPRTHTGASDFLCPPTCGASSSTLGVVTNIAEWPQLRKRGAAAAGGRAWAGARGVGRSVGAGAPRRG